MESRFHVRNGSIYYPRNHPALRYSSRSLKKELAGDFDCAFAFPFSATSEPIIKLALAEVVPSDDPDHAFSSGAVRFALAASIDRAIASNIGRTCSDDLLLLFILCSLAIDFEGSDDIGGNNARLLSQY